VFLEWKALDDLDFEMGNRHGKDVDWTLMPGSGSLKKERSRPPGGIYQISCLKNIISGIT